MSRFIEWDGFDLRVNGDKLNALVASMRVEPVERIELQFFNGLMRVSGTVRKFVAVPFSVDISEIAAAGRTVRVPLRGASAFGVIPIPQVLFGLLRNRLPPELVRYEDPATLVFSLDRFLPTFIDAEIQKIWIIDGGLAVTLGRGGADLPPASEERR